MTEQPHFREEFLAFLCCPDCKGPLRLASASTLNCAACAHDFPIFDGVPDLRPAQLDPQESEDTPSPS
jgi:uncharacterized protein YbaR (Trm112 family)